MTRRKTRRRTNKRKKVMKGGSPVTLVELRSYFNKFGHTLVNLLKEESMKAGEHITLPYLQTIISEFGSERPTPVAVGGINPDRLPANYPPR